MTTEHSTMMAPTDRSMPAVSTIRVWAMPTMPMIVTCCRMSDRLNGAKNLPPTSAAKNTRAGEENDKGNNGRIGVAGSAGFGGDGLMRDLFLE